MEKNLTENQHPENPKVKHSIIIQVLEDGTYGIEAKTDDSIMSIRDQRTLLRQALDNLEDQKMATFVSLLVDQMLSSKIKPDGFRLKSVKDFLVGK